jgi:hypothetical protein
MSACTESSSRSQKCCFLGVVGCHRRRRQFALLLELGRLSSRRASSCSYCARRNCRSSRHCHARAFPPTVSVLPDNAQTHVCYGRNWEFSLSSVTLYGVLELFLCNLIDLFFPVTLRLVRAHFLRFLCFDLLGHVAIRENGPQQRRRGCGTIVFLLFIGKSTC